MITTRNEFLSQPNFYLDQSLRHIQSNQPIRSWTNFLYPGAKREKKHVGEPVRILVFILLLIGARFLSQNQGIAGLQMTSWRPYRTKARADKGWAVKRALRSSFNVWCGVGLARALFPRFRCAWRPAKFFFANRKSYFLSVISGYNVKKINLFDNNINKQFHMFVFACL